MTASKPKQTGRLSQREVAHVGHELKAEAEALGHRAAAEFLALARVLLFISKDRIEGKRRA